MGTAGELILTEEPLLSVQREFSFPLSMDEDEMQARAQRVSLSRGSRRVASAPRSSSERAAASPLRALQPRWPSIDPWDLPNECAQRATRAAQMFRA